MAGPKIFPKGMQSWPAQAITLTPDECQRHYENGFVGAYEEPEEREKFEDEIFQSGGFVYGAEAAEASGFADSGAGKLSMPWVFTQLFFPHCWPGAGQERGDCVSHNEKNANMTSYGGELAAGKPDEVSGKYETAPEIGPEALKQGAFSTETIYWFRRHGGDGWSCDASARVAMRECGLLPRADYSSTLGVDLTRYSGRNAGRYGRTPPSGEVADALDDNLVRTATTIRSLEETRDFLNNLYGISSCGSEGFSNRRDENGVSGRRGRWAHAMAYIGCDDRDVIKRIYREMLVLVLNSWSVWNSGPRDVLDSAKYVPGIVEFVQKRFGKSKADAEQWLLALDIVNPETGNVMIPKGSFWAKWSDIRNRRAIAKSSVAGWEKRSISLGFEGHV